MDQTKHIVLVNKVTSPTINKEFLIGTFKRETIP